MEQMKAVLQWRGTPAFRSLVEQMCPPWLQVAWVREDDPTTFAAQIADADVLWHVLEPVTAAMMGQGTRLQLIQKFGVGVNTIDLVAAAEKGIAVANMPGSNTTAVVEATLLLMLAVQRKLRQMDAAVRTGTWWSGDMASLDCLGELAGKTVGIVGMGDIGSGVAKVCAAFGAQVIYTARSPKPVDAAFVTLPDLLASADVVSLHVPLTADTHHLIGAHQLSMMKPTAVLINTARGGLVDTAALTQALVQNRLSGAGLDVFDPEPPSVDDPLLALPQVVMMPHVAWLTPETLTRSLAIAIENVDRLRSRQPLRFVV